MQLFTLSLLVSILSLFLITGCSSYEKQERDYRFEQMKADKQKQQAEKSFQELDRVTNNLFIQ